MFYKYGRLKLSSVSIFLLAFGALAFSPVARAQENYQPSAANLAARDWYQDAKFGLFIHWGVYSVLGDGEWVMNNRQLTVEEYEKLPAFFDPTEFDAAAWVALVKAAGMKYITITSKHHDGFAMFGTKQSDWNIVDRTPYKKDVLKMLADECHRQGIKLFFYHSQLDWHNPNYYPRGRTGHETGRPESGDWYKYLDYMDAQLRELLTNYGEIGGIWFDGMWDKPEADWRLAKTYQLIHDLQPQALIGSNHHHSPFPGEDFQMFEKDLPGQNTAGFNQTAVISRQLPLETCETMNNAWGFNLKDTDYKSTRQLIQYLVQAAGHNANFLLNVGPMPNGKIQPEFQTRLQEIGQWLARYGESIYGTRGGPIAPRPWGVTTQKGTKVYVHILDWPDASLALPGQVKSAHFLKDGRRGDITEAAGGLALQIPADARDDFDTIAVLELGER
jgi:alpha-L-fucosidase